MSLALLLLGFGCTPGGTGKTDCDLPLTWYPDSDSDGFGNAEHEGQESCEAPGTGWVNNGSDCDDTNRDNWPGAPEVCDALDNDCDGTVDEDAPGGGTWYADADGDGYGNPESSIESCDVPAGYIQNIDDCDDENADTYPGASEICDGIDNDCDNSIPADETDSDGDGVYSCNGDCDDTEAAAYPGATEVCDGFDNNCNNEVDETGGTNTYYLDADGDGIGVEGTTTTACFTPAGYADAPGDCDDTDASEPGWADANATSSGTGTAASPFDSIQRAVDAGQACVLVLPGTYSESIEVNNTAIEISSTDGSAATFVAGTTGPAFFLNSSPSTLISGFTIIDGQGINAQDAYYTELGHAFYVDGGNVWLNDVVVDGIVATLLHDGTNDANGALGLYATHGSAVDLEDVTLQNLQGTWGAAMYISESTVTGRRVSFLDNGVGFTLVHIVGRLDLEAVRVAGNYEINDSWVSSSQALFYLYDGEFRFQNGTIADNDIAYIGSPHDARSVTDPDDQGAWFSIASTIVAFNPDAQFFESGSAAFQPEVSNTDLYDNAANDSSTWLDLGGNITANPLLVSLTVDSNFTGDDLHLQSNSPCVDAGPSTETDVDGSRADIGAYGGSEATW